MPKTQGAWFGLAGAVCLVIAAFGWFFFISPKLDEEASIRGQEVALVAENDALQLKVTALKAEFAQIEVYESELAAAQVKIPTTPDVEAMFDEIDSIATAQGVVLTSIAAEAATPLAGEVAAPVAPVDPAAATTDEPVAAPAAPDALVLFPLKVSFTATHDQTRAFFQALQTTSDRYFLLSNPIITTSDGASVPVLEGVEAASGTPLQVSMTVYAFVYTDNAVAAEVVADESLAPVAPSDRDPFASLASQ